VLAMMTVLGREIVKKYFFRIKIFFLDLTAHYSSLTNQP
jgi:hypothetical protein